MTWLRRAWTIVWQVALLWGIDEAANLIVHDLHIPLPGSIFGCLLLFALLCLRVVPVAWLEQGANWLLAQLLLFFVPSAVGIIQYKHLMWTEGGRLLAVIGLGTVLVMAVTGLIAEWFPKVLERSKRTSMNRDSENTSVTSKTYGGSSS
ncbi:MAG: CidA/LrgA family protein [Alicyclobacillus herbarius]|uniref:CidA/LrgA family protein n=1 Tax=Alicyclobacillus herbarius TaxID=122960 RepID=UPI002353528E|nr:CidA/LrgA family protein [Alicyclobacillus herbarius]MCL6631784.1 CidA/LrgA family protein [Alicyclobacillus herbarius]